MGRQKWVSLLSYIVFDLNANIQILGLGLCDRIAPTPLFLDMLPPEPAIGLQLAYSCKKETCDLRVLSWL